MTDTTPAIERAARARWNAGVRQQWQRVENEDEWPSWVTPEARDRQRDLARAALTAALDVHEMAQVLDPVAFGNTVKLGSEWEHRRRVALHNARAIRAAILGEAP